MPENPDPIPSKPVAPPSGQEPGVSAGSLLASLSLADLYQKLNATPRGLSSAEAERCLKQYGWNDPLASHTRSSVAEFFLLFTNPLVVILLIASLLSAILGDIVNAAIISAIVVLSIVVNFWQTHRSLAAVEKLKSQVALTATVLRDGAWKEVTRRDVVPGDVIELRGGDMVPADAHLITARDLHVYEAALTGESLPVEKIAEETNDLNKNVNKDANKDVKGYVKSPADAPDPDGETTVSRRMVYLGTSIVRGTAQALVASTGLESVFGDISARLALKAPENEFERGARAFGMLIMRTTIALVVFVLVVFAVTKHPMMESLLFALALAVGLTPEFLPMIITVTLAQGAVRMARKHVIVKQLASIQNFGSIDILCSDKTGTLTSGRMVLEQEMGPFAAPAHKTFLLGYLNSYFQTGVNGTFGAAIRRKAEKNPLDFAILEHETPNIEAYQKLDEIPFDFERRCVSVVVKNGEDHLLIAKGSPEYILNICGRYELDGKEAPLDEPARA